MFSLSQVSHTCFLDECDNDDNFRQPHDTMLMPMLTCNREAFLHHNSRMMMKSSLELIHPLRCHNMHRLPHHLRHVLELTKHNKAARRQGRITR
jgi:hypothetical protein